MVAGADGVGVGVGVGFGVPVAPESHDSSSSQECTISVSELAASDVGSPVGPAFLLQAVSGASREIAVMAARVFVICFFMFVTSHLPGIYLVISLRMLPFTLIINSLSGSVTWNLKKSCGGRVLLERKRSGTKGKRSVFARGKIGSFFLMVRIARYIFESRSGKNGIS